MSLHKSRAAIALLVAGSAVAAIGSFAVLRPAQLPPATAATATAQTPALAASQFVANASGHLARIKPALISELDALGSSGVTGVFVHFSSGSKAEQDALLAAAGITLVRDFRKHTDAVFASGSVTKLLALATQPSVSYLEQNVKLDYFGETGAWATRVRVAQERVQDGPYLDGSSRVLMGDGVGLAVVDSGVNVMHPDFSGNVARNYKITCATPGLINTTTGLCFAGAMITDLGPMVSSDTTGGHGTHCAGIALGNGSASKGLYPVADAPAIEGSFTGVAPKASLYAYGAGEGLNIFYSSEAFDHILDNNGTAAVPGTFSPRVRVVSNSYGVGPDMTTGIAPEYDPADVFSQLTIQLVSSGVSVVFAAGNSGDATANDTTSPTCKDPTPGVICVASYNDVGTGSRSGPLSDFTSQGPLNDASKYPDIAAPGHDTTSPCVEPQPGQAVCATGAETRWFPYYGTISGTSMATPHVAGALALMYQANPNLTPMQAERFLQNSALKVDDPVYGPLRAAYVSDPQNPGASTNYRAGAGLMDASAALKLMATGVTVTGYPASGLRTVVNEDPEANVSPAAADIVSLTLEEGSNGGGNGIFYGLTVRDLATLGSATQVNLIVESNVDGKHYATHLAVTAGSLVNAKPRSPENNAPATNVVVTGNRIRFFVPLASLGSPSLYAPVHNIVAHSTSITGGQEADADFAPGSTDVAAVAAMQPAYGKPYTILNASIAPPAVVQDICTAPGATVLTDADGDSLAPSPALDIQSLSISQVFAAGQDRIFFHLKMADLSGTLPAATTWPVRFCAPGFACTDPGAAVAAANRFYTVRMTTDTSVATAATPAAPVFQLVRPTGTATATTAGPALAVSNYQANGLITIVVNASDLGFTALNRSIGPLLSRVQAGLVTPDNMPDSLAGAGTYIAKVAAFCAPNTPPVALLSATPNPATGTKGFTVNFSGAGSSDPDTAVPDTIASYTFDFGDGSAPFTPTPANSSSASHAYTRTGSYTASLKVKDSRGLESINTTNVLVTATNTAPIARIGSDYTGPARNTLTVAFDASTSSDPDTTTGCTFDCVVSYSFDLDGDGTYEITDSTDPRPSKTYGIGSFTPKVVVKDKEGLESAATALAQTIVVNANNAPMTRLAQTSYTGSKPLAVSLNASTSSDPDSDAITCVYSFGDGTPSVGPQACGTVNHTYAAVGSYTASVTATDSLGLAGNTATASITVNNDPPIARLKSLNGTSGAPGFTVNFDASESTDPNGLGEIASYSFDFDGDGTYDLVDVTNAKPSFSYANAGTYKPVVKVTDVDGGFGVSSPFDIAIAVANTAPTARLKIIGSGSGAAPLVVNFDAGDSTDPEGNALMYAFDLDGDGIFEDYSSSKTASRSYNCTTGGPCKFSPSVKVKDTGNLVSAVFTLTNGVVVSRYENITGRLDFTISGNKTVTSTATPEYPSGTYEFKATLCKKSTAPAGEVFSNLSSITTRLDNGNGLVSRDSGPAGVGSIQNIAGKIPGCQTENYVVGLKSKTKFTILVNFNGTVEVP